MKRIISIAVVLLSIALTANAYVTIDDIFYNIENGEASVTYGESAYYNSSRYIGDITIPESISLGNDTYPVTSIGNYAFYQCDRLTSVSLPNSIKDIQDYAFTACVALTGIEIPNSVSSIGNYAFYRCNGINSLDIPKSVASIGNDAFSECKGLIEISIDPHSNLYIGADAFQYCSNLKYVKTTDIAKWCGIRFETKKPDRTLPSLGSNPCDNTYATLYLGTKKITSLEIPDGITEIKDCAFIGCNDITSVTLPSSVKSIGKYAFYGCSLSSITIPNSVKSIGEGVFQCCSITDLDFWPKAVTIIPKEAFSYCYKLTSLCIPEGVTAVGAEAFSGCSNLTDLTVPTTLESLGLNVFKGCTSLSTVTWNAVSCNNFISYLDLDYCDGCPPPFNVNPESPITLPLSFTIGDEVRGIPSYLCDYTRIKSLTVPNSVKHIGDYAFEYCHIERLTLGTSVEYIGASAFAYNDIEELVIPNSATTIAGAAFRGCQKLKDVTLGSAVNTIGNYAFSKCKGITSIDLPSSLEIIGDAAFELTGLQAVTIPNSVTSIGRSAFLNCRDIASIALGNSVESIDSWAFKGCNLITHITIPASVKLIGDAPFPETLTTVEWNAKNCADKSANPINSPFFSNCTLTSLNFGNEVERIPGNICKNQTALTKISFPASVKAIGPNPLKGCTGLQKITSHITEPMTVALGLTDEQLAQLPLYIPKGTTEAYLNALGWADFSNMIEMEGTIVPGDLDGDEIVDGSDESMLVETVLAGGVSAELKAVADINGDGSVDGNDVSILLEKVLAGE